MRRKRFDQFSKPFGNTMTPSETMVMIIKIYKLTFSSNI